MTVMQNRSAVSCDRDGRIPCMECGLFWPVCHDGIRMKKRFAKNDEINRAYVKSKLDKIYNKRRK